MIDFFQLKEMHPEMVTWLPDKIKVNVMKSLEKGKGGNLS